MQRNAIISLLAFLSSTAGSSQQYPFVHYSPKEGLVNNRARSMIQDKRGLLYISTFGGLSVYDGSRFTNYTTEDGLSSDLINDIVELGEDSLWIITNSPKMQSLIHGELKEMKTRDGFCPIINKMIRAQDGSYYALADEGLFLFRDNLFTRIKMTNDHGIDIGKFLADGIEYNNKLFLVTDQHINIYPGAGSLIIFDLERKTAIFSANLHFFFVALSPNGEIIVSTKKGTKKLDEKALLQNKIELTSLDNPFQSAGKYLASYLYFDRDNNLWLATFEGVVRIDRKGQETRFSTENGLLVNHQESIFQDRENTMWFLNVQIGISKLSNPQFQFYSQISPGFSTSDIYANDRSDSVWFLDAEHNKILIMAGNSQVEFQLHHDTHNSLSKIGAATGKTGWLTDETNIYQLNVSSGKKPNLDRLPYNREQMQDKGATYMHPDDHGNLLVLSNEITAILQNRKTISFQLGYFSDKFFLLPDGILWTITRDNKLFKFRTHPDQPDHYFELVKIYDRELPRMNPRTITVDKKGRLWVGTRNDGIFCFRLEGDSISVRKQFTKRTGLSDNFVSYLHTDTKGAIWACSAGGLDKIEENNGSFSIQNITRSKNIYQYVIKVQTNKEGFHWVRTAFGVLKIPPDETNASLHPQMIFRKITAGRNKVEFPNRQVKLSYKENYLSFTLASPSFIDESQLRFSYLLEGSPVKRWSDLSNQSLINFVNLSPGHYRLRAKSIFLNGRYPDSEATFSFIIYPPWWQSWWARLIAIIIVLLSLTLGVRSYYRRKLHKQELVLEKHRAIQKERTRIATDMHDDLGTVLSRILFLTESIRRKKPAEIEIQPEINKISNYSHEMIEKMGEIVWALNEKNDTVADLVAFTRSYAVEYLQNHGIEYEVEAPADLPQSFIKGETRRNIFLSVKESLFNVIKHAGAGMVKIVFEVNAALTISIHDNGRGIDWQKVRPNGNGILNIRKRMESIHGQAEFIIGQGTTVKLTIPMTDDR